MDQSGATGTQTSAIWDVGMTDSGLKHYAATMVPVALPLKQANLESEVALHREVKYKTPLEVGVEPEQLDSEARFLTTNLCISVSWFAWI